MRDPIEPDFNCPHIDDAIYEMEKVRKNCEELRSWGNQWKDIAENRADKISQLVRDAAFLSNRIEELENEISGLRDNVKGLEEKCPA